MSGALAQLAEAGYALGPALLMVAVGVASSRFLDVRPDATVGRIGVGALGAQVAVALLVLLLVGTLPEEPSRSGTCPDGDVLQGRLAALLCWASPPAGGLAGGAAFVLANRNVWLFRSLVVMVVALVLSYASFVALLWAALCGLS